MLTDHNLTIEEEGKKKGITEERTRHQEEDTRLRGEVTRLSEELRRVRRNQAHSPIDSQSLSGSQIEPFTREDDQDPNHDQGYAGEPASKEGFWLLGFLDRLKSSQARPGRRMGQ